MKIRSISQVPRSAIEQIPFDVVIAASGYESRATFISKKANIAKAKYRLAFGFTDRVTATRQTNDKTFKRLGFHPVESAGSSGEVVRSTVNDVLTRVGGQQISILVDYSSMTKSWYGSLLRLLASSDLEQSEVDIYFAYTCSKFTQPAPAAPNRYMGPVPGFCHFGLPDKKTALVLGLCYEAERATGLAEYVEPAEVFAFYTDPALNRRFARTVRKNNAQLLARIGEGRIFKHPMTDLQTTATLLSSLCFGLTHDFRVILAPLGPKPFALLCFLLATSRREFDVWRVSAGEEGCASDRSPSGQIIIARVTFSHSRSASV